MTAVVESLSLKLTPELRYLLRWADSALIHAQRLSEWCGHGPILEEDIALTNMALDLVGQARALLTRVGQLEGQGFEEDQLAFLRDEGDFLNLTLVEQPMRRSSAHSPGGDFADTVVRNFLLATWMKQGWQRLQSSARSKQVQEQAWRPLHSASARQPSSPCWPRTRREERAPHAHRPR